MLAQSRPPRCATTDGPSGCARRCPRLDAPDAGAGGDHGPCPGERGGADKEIHAESRQNYPYDQWRLFVASRPDRAALRR